LSRGALCLLIVALALPLPAAVQRRSPGDAAKFSANVLIAINRMNRGEDADAVMGCLKEIEEAGRADREHSVLSTTLWRTAAGVCKGQADILCSVYARKVPAQLCRDVRQLSF
jgi:hypothetical protein